MMAQNHSTVMARFREFDRDNSGALSSDELQRAITAAGITITDSQVIFVTAATDKLNRALQMSSLFEAFDLDRNYYVDYNELLTALSWAHSRNSERQSFPQIVFRFLQVCAQSSLRRCVVSW